MPTKALCIDFSNNEIPPEYFRRMKKVFKKISFISSLDPKLVISLEDADAIFSKMSTKISREMLDVATNLKYIGVLSTGFSAIDAKYARSKHVPVCNLGGYSTEAVAEFSFATLFEAARELERAKLQARRQDYSFQGFMGFELKGKTLGVVGAGKIGSRIAEIGLALGMNVIYFSRKKKGEIEKRGAKKKILEFVLSNSDVVSINLALDKETEGIIDAKRINLLKKNCILFNLAPPKLIDQTAIIRKANKGDILFVFDHPDGLDPTLAKKFLTTKNCIIYPPVAFRTKEANTARWETFISNIENFSKRKPTNVVN